MKSLLLALALTVAALPTLASAPAADASAPKETRKVCVDVKDKQGQPVKNKDGTVKQNCKTVKAHKKLENATEVPKK